jgi:osmotically-inducible protein OsmY
VEYVAEEIRTALARDAHELGISVTTDGRHAVLEGCVETDGQRARVEQIARQVAPQLEMDNRVEVVNLAGEVEKESL